ncbi:MAG: PrsW family glutamic-type intramembrane protease [Patescibacteria group bacterium]
MKFIETFFLGIFIAIISLVTQVFASVVFELFFRLDLDFRYTQDKSMLYIVLVILLASAIEEILRYMIIKKRISHKTSDNIATSIILGFFLGLGFATFEIALISFSVDIMDYSIIIELIPILLIHILLSIFLLLTVKKTGQISKDAVYIVIAIILHTISNTIIFLSQ